MINKTAARILEFNHGRLQAILPYKFSAMQENPFRFFRGAAHLFYEALGKDIMDSPSVWLCGDMHLENFGSFRGSNGLVYFDLNDFDDATLAPVWYELSRMATSIFVAFETLKIGAGKAQHMAQLFIQSYCKTLTARKPDHVEQRTASGIVCTFLERAAAHKKKEIIRKRTLAGKKMNHNHPKQLALEQETKLKLNACVNEWLKLDDNSPYNYHVADSVFRLAGTSSLGLARYSLLLHSENDAAEKYLLLDMKEAAPSPLQNQLNRKTKKWANDAERSVTIQKLMQDRSPALLSTGKFEGKDFIMQEMQPVKDNINFGLLKNNYRNMCTVIDTIGMLAASAHLRGAGHYGAQTGDALALFGSKNNWQAPLLKNCERYASMVLKQYNDFCKIDAAKLF